MEITVFPDQGSNPVCWIQSPTLYHVATKAGMYRKAVQVCYIPIPGDNSKDKVRSLRLFIFFLSGPRHAKTCLRAYTEILITARSLE